MTTGVTKTQLSFFTHIKRPVCHMWAGSSFLYWESEIIYSFWLVPCCSDFSFLCWGFEYCCFGLLVFWYFTCRCHVSFDFWVWIAFFDTFRFLLLLLQLLFSFWQVFCIFFKKLLFLNYNFCICFFVFVCFVANQNDPKDKI